jgi:hypothetical protein
MKNYLRLLILTCLIVNFVSCYAQTDPDSVAFSYCGADVAAMKKFNDKYRTFANNGYDTTNLTDDSYTTPPNIFSG